MFHLSTTRQPPLARETQPDNEVGGDRGGPPRRGPITPFSARVETVLGLQRAAGNRAVARMLSESRPAELGQPGVGSADGYLPGEKEDSLTSPGEVDDTTDVTRIVLYSFPVNKQFVKPEHRARLRKLVHDIRLDQPDTITPVAKIVGFGDAVHRRGGNIELRQDRAEAVELFLLSSGALESNIGPAVAAPGDNFIATNETVEGRARNRAVVVVMDLVPPKPIPNCLPHKLGTGRRINPHAPDLGHHDFPDIEPASTLKLAGFAALHNRSLRQLVADGDWEDDMERELLVAGRPGVRAFERFKAGTRGTAIHGPGSTLGGDALGCRSFRASVVSVQREIERQLSAQAEDGAVDPCRLSVRPPATHFTFDDGRALKIVIGGTQGEELFITAFSASMTKRTYDATVRFVITDIFGVDESDLYSPGLGGFWVLQHERGSGREYAPFINMLDLPVRLTGTF